MLVTMAIPAEGPSFGSRHRDVNVHVFLVKRIRANTKVGCTAFDHRLSDFDAFFHHITQRPVTTARPLPGVVVASMVNRSPPNSV